jgi:hypothetical protein
MYISLYRNFATRNFCLLVYCLQPAVRAAKAANIKRLGDLRRKQEALKLKETMAVDAVKHKEIFALEATMKAAASTKDTVVPIDTESDDTDGDNENKSMSSMDSEDVQPTPIKKTNTTEPVPNEPIIEADGVCYPPGMVRFLCIVLVFCSLY